jgi:hypothetical protein
MADRDVPSRAVSQTVLVSRTCLTVCMFDVGSPLMRRAYQGLSVPPLEYNYAETWHQVLVDRGQSQVVQVASMTAAVDCHSIYHHIPYARELSQLFQLLSFHTSICFYILP